MTSLSACEMPSTIGRDSLHWISPHITWGRRVQVQLTCTLCDVTEAALTERERYLSWDLIINLPHDGGWLDFRAVQVAGEGTINHLPDLPVVATVCCHRCLQS